MRMRKVLWGTMAAVAVAVATAGCGDPSPGRYLTALAQTPRPTAAPSLAPETATPAATPFPTPVPGRTPNPSGGNPLAPPPPAPTPAAQGRPSATIRGTTFRLEVARTVDEQRVGLSGRDALAQDAGMLFPQARDLVPSFWMRGMRISLDFIWITSGCTVAEVTANVPPPAPGTSDSNLPIYSPGSAMRYVLELNAGVAARVGIAPGAAVRFAGAADLGCVGPAGATLLVG
ncbi:MAG: DUF192 domain-containing protein [Dehalococcoidia bacterium]|nr:DUF192 domain-containing protein [Dehalococcoidia bacterium]